MRMIPGNRALQVQLRYLTDSQTKGPRLVARALKVNVLVVKGNVPFKGERPLWRYGSLNAMAT